MKHNQRGFSAVELVIVVVVIGALGLSGWYVWQSQKKEAKKTGTSSEQQAATEESESKPEADPFASWKSYSNPKGSLEFAYPPDWALTEIGSGYQLKSADYAATGLQRTAVTKGASVSVSSPSAPQQTITADNYKSSAAWHSSYSNFKTLSIKGYKVAQYNVDADIINTVVFASDGRFVTFQFQFAPADYDAILGTYTHILETIEIK